MKTAFFPKKNRRGGKYAMLTAYDALTSGILEAAGVDFILVGDSLGMVILGYPNTAAVTMDEMLHHGKAVRRGAPKSCVLGDLPKKGVEKGARHALESAKRFTGAGMNGVKIEWGKSCLEAVELMAKHKILVQGHVGLTPQMARTKADFKMKGKDAASAQTIFKQAKAFEAAGASLLLLECIPWELGQMITDSVKVPTIGIGAGPYCDGQVLVFQDLVGLFEGFKPKFVKHYAETGAQSRKAAQEYTADVRAGRFPGFAQSFSMDPAELEKLKKKITGKK